MSPIAGGPTETAAPGSRPGPIVLLGAPGVGKGTQAETLAMRWEIPTISTGDILRKNVEVGTPLGVQANQTMQHGGLVPDQLITEMVANRLGLSDTENGFILDGFPRTVWQAEWLQKYLGVHQPGTFLRVICMRLDPQRIAERIIHRRVCPLCKTVYNTQSRPPKRSGRCDNDNVELIQRGDDNREVLQRRLDIYQRETEPLIQYYRRHALFIEIDADKPASLITNDIMASLLGFCKQINR